MRRWRVTFKGYLSLCGRISTERLESGDYDEDAFWCAESVQQCSKCAGMLERKAYREVLAAVPPGPCVYCGIPDAETKDHVIPLARGGAHDLTNLVRACRPCNSSKGKLTVAEWIATGRAPMKVAA